MGLGGVYVSGRVLARVMLGSVTARDRPARVEREDTESGGGQDVESREGSLVVAHAFSPSTQSMESFPQPLFLLLLLMRMMTMMTTAMTRR